MAKHFYFPESWHEIESTEWLATQMLTILFICKVNVYVDWFAV